MDASHPSPLAQQIQQAIGQALREMGKVNILIAGSTGVGKSTLTNAIFERPVTPEGIGRTVTKETREWTNEHSPLTLFDTRGLEQVYYREILQGLRDYIDGRRKSRDHSKHIHIAWVCILEASKRVEQAHIELVEMLSDYMPVIVVITQCTYDGGFNDEVQRLLPKANAFVRVRAKTIVLDDGHVSKDMGLPDLVKATAQLIPESERRAFIAAQWVNLTMKQQQAQIIVGTSIATAAAGGAIPIFNGVAPTITQIVMISLINQLWGFYPSTTFMISLFGIIMAGVMTTLGVGHILASLIPILGSLPAAIIAAVSTLVIGEAYITSLMVLTRKILIGVILNQKF